MSSTRRYTFRIGNRSENGKVEIIEVNRSFFGDIFKKEASKTYLPLIDKYTVNFHDEKTLINHLIEERIIINPKSLLEVTYKSNGQIIHLQPAYANSAVLTEFKLKPGSYTEIDEACPMFKAILNEFLYEMSNDIEMKDYLRDNRFFTIRTYQALEDYLVAGKSIYKFNLIKEMCNYKVMRGYIIGKQAYYQSLLKESYNSEEIQNKDFDTQIQIETEVSLSKKKEIALTLLENANLLDFELEEKILNATSLQELEEYYKHPDKEKYEHLNKAAISYKNLDELNANYDLDELIDMGIDVLDGSGHAKTKNRHGNS